MAYLNDRNINADYKELRNEQKMRMLRAEGNDVNHPVVHPSATG